MKAIERITQVYNSAEEIPIDHNSKFIMMSDCHRGDGSTADNFAKNQHLFISALRYYNQEKFTYIELGDGDELWENKNMQVVFDTHKEVFLLLSKFFQDNRLYMIYGNHDRVKENSRFLADNYCLFGDEVHEKDKHFDNIKMHEGLVLRHTESNNEVFLLHGHQGDLINDKLWKVARFLVRYAWRPMEMFGFQNPFETSKNYKKKVGIEKRLGDWSKRENKIVIAGHTHRPVFPKTNDPPYFNDGCTVLPGYITGIEIIEDKIQLVKWSVKTKPDGVMYVGRDIIEGPRNMSEFFEIYTYENGFNAYNDFENKDIYRL